MFKGDRESDQLLDDKRKIDSSLSNVHEKKLSIYPLIDSNAYEFLPKIKLVYKNLLKVLSLHMTNLVETRVELSMLSLSSLTFGKYIELTLPAAHMIIFSSKEWHNYGLVTVNSSLVNTLVEMFLLSEKLKRKNYKAFNNYENTCLYLLSNVIMNGLSESFSFIDKVKFRYERMETDHRFISVCREEEKILLAKIVVNIEGRKGIIDIILPYLGLESIKPLLLDKKDNDITEVSWQDNLKKHVQEMEIRLNAVLESSNYSLEDVLNLKTGSTIIMDAKTSQDVDMIAGGQKILSGKIGNYGNRVAILVNDTIHKNNQSENKK